MRLSFSSLACPGWSVEQICDAAARYRYAGIEWRLADGELLGPKTAAEVWERIAASGVEVACLDTSCVLVRATVEERASTVRYAAAMAKRAADIGAPSIRAFGGAIPDGMSADDVIEPTREVIAQIASSMPAGVRLLVETHDAWSTGEQAGRLVGGLDAGIVWDVAHTVRAGESVQATLVHTGLPGLVHVKDAVDEQLVALGAGRIPLADAVAALTSLGYNGWLSLEWEKLWHPELAEPDDALPAAGAHLAGLLA